MLLYNLLITILLIACFLCCLKSFTIGLNMGKQISNGHSPSIDISPIKPIVNAIKDAKQAETVKHMDNIFSYDASVAMSAIRKGRRDD